MRWSGCVLVWVIVIAAALYVASHTQWGPIVVRLSESHGVHVGDVAAVGVAVLLGVAATVEAYRNR